jgi:predicted nucleic acid-binding protein
MRATGRASGYASDLDVVPDHDYLIALVYSLSAALVSGDGHLLELAGAIPVFTPSEFLAAQSQ